MREDRSEERADSTDITRQDVLQASSKKEDSGRTASMEPSKRRTFLGRTVASVLGIMGLSSGASASPDSQTGTKTLEEPDSQAVAKTLEERREFLEVLVANDIMSEKILQDMDEVSAQSVAESSSVAAKKDEEAGYIVLTFPEESDELRLAFGDELTDVRIAFPDDVDGEAITEEMNREVSGFVTAEGSSCCDNRGPCDLPESEAQDRCEYVHFPVGICGSYSCGMVSCEINGGGVLDWCCACCGGGHWWCGSVPKCPDNSGAGTYC